MIKSKYFADGARCLAEIPDDGNKIEIPADVYDEISDKPDYILRGTYPYEIAKMIAISGDVEALQFDDANGEIKTSSTVGISAEMEFAFAIWNFYNKESAIDRIILARLESGDKLPKLLSDGEEKIQINDSVNINKDIAKSLVKKSSKYFNDKLRVGETVDIDSPVHVSPLTPVIDKVGDIFSTLWDEVAVIGRHAEDIKDFFNSRISFKQLVKNTAVTAVSASGATLGWVLGGLVAGAAGLPAVLAFATSFAAYYGAKKFYKKKTKNKLDILLGDDGQEMLEIFQKKLAEMLVGKFLTPYEMAILMEAIHDDITKDALKEMYACGNDYDRAEWAKIYIERRLKDISNQRVFVEMPSEKDWEEGIKRVNESLKSGADIFAEMDRQREEALQNMRMQLNCT